MHLLRLLAADRRGSGRSRQEKLSATCRRFPRRLLRLGRPPYHFRLARHALLSSGIALVSSAHLDRASTVKRNHRHSPDATGTRLFAQPSPSVARSMLDDISSLRGEILAAIAGAADADALEAVRIQYLVPQRRAARAAGKNGHRPQGRAPRRRQGGQRGQEGDRRRVRRAQGRADRRGRGGRFRSHAARPLRCARLAPSRAAGARPRHRDFPPARLRAGRRARHRERGLQFRRAQHAAGPPRAQRAGHLLSEGRRPRAQPRPGRQNARRTPPDAHADLHRADPRHAAAAAADPHHRAGPLLSPRRDRRDARHVVLPDGGPRRRARASRWPT